MTPGFLVSALVGWATALLVALAMPSRRGGWAWTMIAGLIGGGLSGFALHELGAGELGGAPTMYAPADSRGMWTYGVGGLIGGVSIMVLMLISRAIFYAPKPTKAGGFSELVASLGATAGGAVSDGAARDSALASSKSQPPNPAKPNAPSLSNATQKPAISTSPDTAIRKTLSRMGP
ncbi:MAG: hypothetical protein KTR21_09200 [Rhodobacteraceae bacterium]|nr:hypothetical protein [Paracoccaceae bacterium]